MIVIIITSQSVCISFRFNVLNVIFTKSTRTFPIAYTYNFFPTQVGSCFILESTKEAAWNFLHNDPFFKAGVWASVSVNRYVSIPNGILAHK